MGGFTKSLAAVKAGMAATKGKRKKRNRRKRPGKGGGGGGGGPLIGPSKFNFLEGGKRLGAVAGGWLGNLAGKAFNILRGKGDYTVGPEDGKVNANSLLTPGKAVPVMHSDAHGCVRVTHREYLVDIFSRVSPLYSTAEFVLNPADARTFPWLSTLAAAFTQWKLLGCAFEFVSTSGAISSTQALGSVSMAAQYDVTRPVFRNKRDMLNHYWSTSQSPSRNQMLLIECEPSLTPMAPLYVRKPPLGAVPVTYDPTSVFTWNNGSIAAPATFQEMEDPRLSDHAYIQVFSTGQAADLQVLGELWITYDVMLMKPLLPAPGAVLDTWAPPPATIGDDVLNYTTHAEVPLAAVLPISSTDYPSELKEVDD
jgi:hypothetical protein